MTDRKELKKSIVRQVANRESESDSYLYRIAEDIAEFMNSGGEVNRVTDLVENGLASLKNIDVEDLDVPDADYDRLLGAENKVRIYFWSASKSGSEELTEKGVEKMIEIGKTGDYSPEFLRKCIEDLSDLKPVLGSGEVEEIVSTLEQLVDDITESRKQLSEEAFSERES